MWPAQVLFWSTRAGLAIELLVLAPEERTNLGRNRYAVKWKSMQVAKSQSPTNQVATDRKTAQQVSGKPGVYELYDAGRNFCPPGDIGHGNFVAVGLVFGDLME